MTLQETIRTRMVEALKAKDEITLTTLRGLMALMTQELTATKRTPQDALADEEVVGLIRRSVKQRREAAAQFRAGGRADLAQGEERELAVLEAYLPPSLDRAAIEEVVAKKCAELGGADPSAKGKILGAVMQELKGKADGALVREIVEKTLAA